MKASNPTTKPATANAGTKVPNIFRETIATTKAKGGPKKSVDQYSLFHLIIIELISPQLT
jgi:hypothetical protein